MRLVFNVLPNNNQYGSFNHLNSQCFHGLDISFANPLLYITFQKQEKETYNVIKCNSELSNNPSVYRSHCCPGDEQVLCLETSKLQYNELHKE